MGDGGSGSGWQDYLCFGGNVPDEEMPQQQADSRHTPPAKKEPDLEALLQKLQSMTDGAARRGVLSLMGLCLGDIVGLPFEFSSSNLHRADAARERSVEELQRLVLEASLMHVGWRGVAQPYARSFSDDTVCADLKMQAVVQCSTLRKIPEFQALPQDELLWRCLLSQFLAWSYGPSRGALFQGYGAFTKAMLRPEKWAGNDLVTALREGVPGCNTWPTEAYKKHASNYCAGHLESPASYGNGAVMSFVPQVLAEVLAPKDEPVPKDGLKCLAMTHQHETAVAASELLSHLLRAIFAGEVSSPSDLQAAVRKSPPWQRLMQPPFVDELVHPLRQFDAFLSEAGDCDLDSASFFMQNLTGSAEDATPLEPPLRYSTVEPSSSAGVSGAILGRLLRTASNLQEDRGSRRIRFSQRGLNTVLIAIWCCAGVSSVGEWISRLLYVGGDADTIGAASGQIAGPLLPIQEVCDSFRALACLCNVQKRPSAIIAAQASCRFLHRALLFCTGQWTDLIAWPRLVDPVYPDITNSRGSAFEPMLPGQAVRVLWVDKDFSAGNGRDFHTRGQLKHIQQAVGAGLLDVLPVDSPEVALLSLQESRTADGGIGRVDAVVTEMGWGPPYEGFKLLEAISQLWDKCYGDRPAFLGLTSRWDRQLLSDVKRHPRAALQRRDKPEEIVNALVRGHYQAATIPGA